MEIYLLWAVILLYAAQTIEIIIRKISGKNKQQQLLLLLPIILIPAYAIGGGIFWFLFLLISIFWCLICRSADYGFSYHIPMIIAGGIAFGPIGGIILGTIPFMMVPLMMPDKTVMDLVVSSIILSLIGAISFLFGSSEAQLLNFSVIALIIYNLIRGVALFGKIPMHKIAFYSAVNIGVSYLLIEGYLIKLIEMITGGSI